MPEKNEKVSVSNTPVSTGEPVQTGCMYILNINTNDGEEGPTGTWFTFIFDFEREYVTVYKPPVPKKFFPHSALCAMALNAVETNSLGTNAQSFKVPGLKSQAPKVMGTIFNKIENK